MWWRLPDWAHYGLYVAGGFAGTSIAYLLWVWARG